MTQDVGSSHGTDKPGEKQVGPEATVEAEAELIKVALQMLFAQAMVGSLEKSLQIGDQGVYPAQSAATLDKDGNGGHTPHAARREKTQGHRCGFRCQEERYAGQRHSLPGHPDWKPGF